jgi:anti-anti-sigma factor
MAHPIVEVYATGPTTVVGFGGRDVLADVNLAVCREDLAALIQQHACEILAFDLTGVKFMPSGLLGLLASLRQQGVEIHLYNPSEDVRDALQTTHLDRIMPIHDIKIEGRSAR